MTTPSHIKFDIMLKGRFAATMSMPLCLSGRIGTDGDFYLSESEIVNYILHKRPSLGGKPFQIHF